ncbi:MAG: hypothetical protein GXX93_04295 [Anaerolineae bacterium]|nr:hypothetical protein [Anaerolineae bacterium]
MAHYTLDHNHEIDSTIERHLIEIRDVLLAELSAQGCRPQAILLSGSFGRGEGSAWYQEGAVHIASDYEINVVCDSWRARKALERARRRFADSTPVPVSLSQITSRRLRQGRTRNLSFGPPRHSIYMYEVKAASQVLHGSLDGLLGAVDPTIIPPEEGVLLVSNRMLEVLESWLRPQQDGLEHALAKLVLACGDAVLLSRGLYHYSYVERAQRLAELPSEVVRAYLGDRFHSVYSEAVSRKLWPSTAAAGGAGLRYQLPAVAGFAREGLRWLGCRTAPSGEPEVLLPVSYTPGRLPVPPVLFEDAVSWVRAKRARRPVGWRRLPVEARLLSLRQLLYRAIPALFLSLPQNGSDDGDMLAQAWYWAGWTVGDRGAGTDVLSGRSWETLAGSVLSTWHAIA